MSVTPNSIVTPQKPRSKVVALNLTAAGGITGNTPTNLVAIVPPVGFDGGRLVKLTVKPRDTVVACRVLLFKSENNGANAYLVDDRDIAAYTWSNTVGPNSTQKADFNFSDSAPALFGGNGASATEQFLIGQSVTQTGGGFVAYAEWAEY